MINEKVNQTNNYWYLAAIALILFFIDISGSAQGIRDGVLKVFQPSYYVSIDFVKKVNNFKNNVFGTQNSQGVILSLQTKINELEVIVADYEILKEKYESLLKQSKINEKKYEYIKAQVYKPTDGSEVIINIGSESDVSKGDIVVVENVYVGIVDNVDGKSSSLITPENSRSVIEVLIQKTNSNVSPVRVVALGRNNEIIIENVPSNAGVENGDLVVINDKRVSQPLILGVVNNLVKDPAASVLSAKVTSSVNLLLTKFVYVRK